MEKLTQERLKEVLNYDQLTGIFTWKMQIGSRSKIGNTIGTLNGQGYLRIMINKKSYRSHRLAWLYVYGDFPKNQIDHINGIRNDNRICNLREAKNAENLQNMKTSRKDNLSTGLLGTSYDKSRMRFVAQININGKHINLGRFETKEKAHKVYVTAKREIHPFGML